MNSANLNAVCSLCRRDLSQGMEGNASKLCDDCRSMIETIRPRTPKTAPLGGAPEFKGDLSLERPIENQTPALSAQASPTRGEPQSELQSQLQSELQTELRGHPLKEYEAATTGRQYSGLGEEDLGQWPLVLKDDSERHRSKTLLAVLAVALLLVGGAGLFLANRYFGARRASAGVADNRQVNLISSPPRSGVEKPAQTGSAPATAPPEEGKPIQEVSRPVQSQPQAAPTPVEQPAHSATPTSGETGGGKFTSFQIASFPNEAAAKEFCDRLIRAGLPAYTVRADIPGRGKWFRVRAGKFSNPQESQQSATAWRRLAAAAGINLQLVQCDYEP